MSEMTVPNKKLMLAGMFLSKFNRRGLEALGYKSLREAYNSFDVEAFRSRDAAIAWIEKQISEKIDTYNLREGAVDGWCVEIDGPRHTIQYDLKKCVLK